MFHRIDESTFEVNLPGLVVLTVEWCEQSIVLHDGKAKVLLWLWPTLWRRSRGWWPVDPETRGRFVKSGASFVRYHQLGPLDIRTFSRPRRV